MSGASGADHAACPAAHRAAAAPEAPHAAALPAAADRALARAVAAVPALTAGATPHMLKWLSVICAEHGSLFWLVVYLYCERSSDCMRICQQQ
jgi:hypothetical protein